MSPLKNFPKHCPATVSEEFRGSRCARKLIGLKGFYSSDLNRLGGDEDISYSVDFLSGKEGKAVVSLDNRFFEVWENPKAPVKKTVLMIRDSFGLALMPYLDKTFLPKTCLLTTVTTSATNWIVWLPSINRIL